MNNMYVCEIPTELSSLEKLEKIRIAQRIVFEKIGVLHKGHRASSLLRESSSSRKCLSSSTSRAMPRRSSIFAR